MRISKYICALLFCCIFSNIAFAQETSAAIDTSLTDAQLAAFSQQAKNSVTDFSGHVKHIADKSISTYLRKKYIKNALVLFSDPDVNTVEVSSLKDKTHIETPTTRQYLDRLMNLNYTQVNIIWFNIRITNFVKGKDGNYYATATVFQKFEGIYNNNELHTINREVMRKSISVSIIKKMNTYEGARKIDDWELKLGDIKVAVAKL